MKKFKLFISAHVAVTDGRILPSTHLVLISKPYKAKLSQGYKGPW